jgi:protein-S-isoprenylcysteine O-methyltransferase Ste14
MAATAERGEMARRLDWRRLVRFLFAVPVYFGLFMFLPAGTFAWDRGWVFIAVFVSSLAVVGAYLWRANPDVVVARTSFHEGTKRWDRILVPLLLVAFYAIIPVAALDDSRFRWFPLPWWVCAIGYILFFAAMALVTRAEAVNKFFEVTVRLQTDRGQTVVDTGPYAVVRHPGYVAGIVLSVAAALCLGSLWALIPAGVASGLLILRTLWEDETLQAELSGYKEYAQRVRYRLVPGIW